MRRARSSGTGRSSACRRPISGANNFWLWGPPPAADTSAIAVNVDPALLRREFRHVRHVATFWNGLGVSDDEQGAQIFLATGLRSSWAQGVAGVPRTTPEVAGPGALARCWHD